MPTISSRTPVRARRNAAFARGRNYHDRDPCDGNADDGIEEHNIADVSLEIVQNASPDGIPSSSTNPHRGQDGSTDGNQIDLGRDMQISSAQAAASSAAPSVATARNTAKKRSHLRQPAASSSQRAATSTPPGAATYLPSPRVMYDGQLRPSLRLPDGASHASTTSRPATASTSPTTPAASNRRVRQNTQPRRHMTSTPSLTPANHGPIMTRADSSGAGRVESPSGTGNSSTSGVNTGPLRPGPYNLRSAARIQNGERIPPRARMVSDGASGAGAVAQARNDLSSAATVMNGTRVSTSLPRREPYNLRSVARIQNGERILQRAGAVADAGDVVDAFSDAGDAEGAVADEENNACMVIDVDDDVRAATYDIERGLPSVGSNDWTRRIRRRREVQGALEGTFDFAHLDAQVMASSAATAAPTAAPTMSPPLLSWPFFEAEVQAASASLATSISSAETGGRFERIRQLLHQVETLHSEHITGSHQAEATRRRFAAAEVILKDAPERAATEEDGQLCSICQEDVIKGEMIRELPCSKQHRFHTACIDKWIATNPVCPLCRISLAS